MTAASQPQAGLEFHRLHRAGRGGGWWSLLAVVVGILGFVAAQVVVTVAFLVYLVATTDDPADELAALVDPEQFAPLGLLYLLSAISLAIPFVWAGNVLVAGLKPRWLASVRPGIRWGWLGVCLATAVAALVLAVVLSAFVPGATTDDVGGGANDFTRTTFDFLLIVVLLVPFQAAAEEYVFRGFLAQAFGGFLADERAARVLAVAGPALLFALAHGSQSWPIFIDRLAFGVVAGILAIATGGLEAGIAYHVVNNYLAFTLALLFGDIGASLDPQGGNGWDIVVSVVKSGVFLALVLGAARAMSLPSRTAPTELVAPTARV